MEGAEHTRERLMGAMLDLISEKGYTGATTREIAARAGVSELTLFRNFGSKERLFEEVLANYTFLPRLREMLPQLEGRSIGEGLTAVGERFLMTLRERSALVRILLSEITTYPEKVRALHRRMIEDLGKTLAVFLEGQRKSGAIRDLPCEAVSMMFLRSLFALFINETIVRGRTMSDRTIREGVARVVDIFLNGIAAPGKA